MTGSAAGMFSGCIQAGLYTSMTGTYGTTGWQRTFIIGGIISTQVAIMGYFCLPDFPNTTGAHYLKDCHRKYALARMDSIGRAPHVPLTRKTPLAIYKTPRPYVLTLLNLSASLSGCGGYFNLRLKSSHKFTVSQLNTIPTSASTVALVSAHVLGQSVRRYTYSFAWILAATNFPFKSAVMMTVWNIANSAKMSAFLISSAGAPATPLLITWSYEWFQDISATRGITIGTSNTINYGMSA
ncbi:hypothetical protein V1512DRAFT_254176 [Lipomyces arxii]|uniref:uncharacterized protein n=1 Tax=Lipomyces arxii TaxID=56418 RepID=UPI0034CE5A6E